MTTPFGHWLQNKIAEIPQTVLGFAAQIGVHESTLHRWFKQSPPKIRRHLVTKLAKALHVTREEVIEQISISTQPGSAGPVSPPLPPAGQGPAGD